MLPVLAGNTCQKARSCENCVQSPPNIQCDTTAVTSRQTTSSATARTFNCGEQFETEKDDVEGNSKLELIQPPTTWRSWAVVARVANTLPGESGLQCGQNRSRGLGMSRMFGAICREHQAVDPLIFGPIYFSKALLQINRQINYFKTACGKIGFDL